MFPGLKVLRMVRRFFDRDQWYLRTGLAAGPGRQVALVITTIKEIKEA
jgi:hypothetical protein